MAMVKEKKAEVAAEDAAPAPVGLSEMGKNLLKLVKEASTQSAKAKEKTAAVEAQASAKSAAPAAPTKAAKAQAEGHPGVHAGPTKGPKTVVDPPPPSNGQTSVKPGNNNKDETPKLSRQVLEEIHQRVLVSINPQFDVNVVEFNFKTFEFRPSTANRTVVVLCDIPGNLVETETEDVRRLSIEEEDDAVVEEEPVEEKDEGTEPPLIQAEELDDTAIENLEDSEVMSDIGDKQKYYNDDERGDDEGDEGDHIGEDSTQTEDELKKKGKKKKLTNQFNFSDRGALTYSVVVRDGSTQTVPPPTATMSGQVTQWRIFDYYQKDYENLIAQKEKDRMVKTVVGKKDEDARKTVTLSSDESYNYRLSQATKIMERMVNQNTFEEIAFDCQFYDDPADKYRQNEGGVLPLWEFKHDESKGLTVTDLTWNSKYYDMFGVSFGSFTYKNKLKKGVVCVYTLKNPAYPEKIIRFRSGAMCIDFHNTRPYYLAIGLYDGSLCVFNVKEGDNHPLLYSNVWKKHSGSVWEVHWCDDPRDTQLCFYSVGSDGKICKWLVLPNELAQTPVITLYLDIEKIDGPDGISFSLTASPKCVAFDPENYEIFLVGTAEGNIYKCSVSYASSYLHLYYAHDMPVNRISYNNYLCDIFASCSDDWRVKIWEDKRSEPLFVFDLECVVGDIQWAPYSSTVFAAVTSDGNIHIYDLNINKHDAICVQTIFAFEQSIATRLRFNNKIPIILAGDSKGHVISVKVSPNCRLPTKAPKKMGAIEPGQLEVMKLEKVLAFVREPAVNGDIINEGNELRGSRKDI
ncbi:dynein intermediate chain 2, ciliary isoform X2 [Cimex lectularius]|uniref:Dynein intermediate chain 2, ciliary n=1 Tax=Cimex lectularius TaxID=79782 RepID=A0A8I6SPD0_CIMLE|nr:dynein intermediate chain 2, ciliary isoform X2 [Cimex lectularius]